MRNQGRAGAASYAVKILGIATVFVIATGQASTEGCAPETDGVPVSDGGGAAQFTRYDVNEDGWLSGNELDACDCAQLDANGDGEVARAEFMAGSVPSATPGEDSEAVDTKPSDAAPEVTARPADPSPGGPPLGKYVCKQGVSTTMGYLTLLPGNRYQLVEGGTQGTYAFDAATGEVRWESGKYAEWGWVARYDYRSAESLGRPLDENIIRMTDDTGRLKIDCFLMRP